MRSNSEVRFQWPASVKLALRFPFTGILGYARLRKNWLGIRETRSWLIQIISFDTYTLVSLYRRIAIVTGHIN